MNRFMNALAFAIAAALGGFVLTVIVTGILVAVAFAGSLL